MTLAIGSLFSGIGGLELGLEWSGLGHVAWQVEIDEGCRTILAQWWPDADRSVFDVRAAFDLRPVDVICGGFPCQDVSGAGKGEGLAGARSGLWFEYARIIRTLQPRWVVVENVASGKSRYLCTVRSDLQDAGYRSAAVALSASDVGAPHRRSRIFVVGYANGAGNSRLARRETATHPEPGVSSELGNADSARRQGRGLGDASRLGARSDVANPSCDGRDQRISSEPNETGRADADRCGGLADADSEGRPQPQGSLVDLGRWPSNRGALSDAHSDIVRRQPGGAIPRSREAEPGDVGEDSDGSAQSRMGRVPHGLPDWLERWPTARNEEQAEWEPPRTITVKRGSNRRARLKGLGNAVVPQCALVIGRMIRAVEEGTPWEFVFENGDHQ